MWRVPFTYKLFIEHLQRFGLLFLPEKSRSSLGESSDYVGETTKYYVTVIRGLLRISGGNGGLLISGRVTPQSLQL